VNAKTCFRNLTSRIGLDSCENGQGIRLAHQAVDSHLRLLRAIDMKSGWIRISTSSEPVVLDAMAWLCMKVTPSKYHWPSSISTLAIKPTKEREGGRYSHLLKQSVTLVGTELVRHYHPCTLVMWTNKPLDPILISAFCVQVQNREGKSPSFQARNIRDFSRSGILWYAYKPNSTKIMASNIKWDCLLSPSRMGLTA